MIKIRLFKKPIWKKLIELWCFKYLNKRNVDKKTLKLYVYFELFIILFTYFISFLIIGIMYVGALIYRYKILKKIHWKIGQEFHKTFNVKRHKLVGFFGVLLYLITWILIISLIFTIPILILMYIGYRIEKKYENPFKKSKQKFVYQNIENQKPNQESKTIGYLNE